MTNTKLLRQKMEDSGYKMRYISDKIGLTYQGLLNKLNNQTEFTASEIKAIMDLLHLTQDEVQEIFFAVEVE